MTSGETGVETLEIVVDRPMGRHNVYAFDERRRRIRLDAVRDVADSRPYDLAHVEDHDERLPVVLLTSLPTFEGCLVRAVLAGAVRRPPAMVLIAALPGDLKLGEFAANGSLRTEALAAAEELLGPGDGPSAVVGPDEARDYLRQWRRDVRTAVARRAQVRTGAAWKALAPGRDGAGPHTWAENLLFTLPKRFQDYVAELLFEDERILFFIDRPPFRPGRRLRGLGARREHEGLLVLTDRMLLFMQDAIPPDITMVHWGYIADIVAVEQLRQAELEDAGPAIVLHLRFESAAGGEEAWRIPFPRSHREALQEVLPLMTSFAAGAPTLPRRLYGDAPSWPHRAGSGLLATRPARAEAGGATTAVSDRGRAVLAAGRIEIEAQKQPCVSLAVHDVTSFTLLRSLTGCRFSVRSGGSRRLEEHAITFDYPQAPGFLELTARLRQLLGNPA